jgi:hypothetical protein
MTRTSCMAFLPSLTQSQCGEEPARHLWQLEHDHLSPGGLDSVCLTRTGDEVVFQACKPEKEDVQAWKMFSNV